MKLLIFLATTFFSLSAFPFAGSHYASGKVTSLLASKDPAIRITGNKSPTQCNGGTYGWLYFSGTPEEKQWLYSTALAMSLAGKVITVYTNADGNKSRINNIQVTSGLN